MPSMQIKDVPEETHAVWRRRAAEAHQSLQEYLLKHVIDVANRPTMDEALARIEGRSDGVSLSLQEISDMIREDRESH